MMRIEPIPVTKFRANSKHYLDLADAAPIFISRDGEVFKLTKISKVVYTEGGDDLDNARPLSPENKQVVDAAIADLKAGKTKLEFEKGWNDIHLTKEEQKELAEIEEAVENGTTVSVETPESKAMLQEALNKRYAESLAAAKAKTAAVAEKERNERNPFGTL